MTRIFSGYIWLGTLKSLKRAKVFCRENRIFLSRPRFRARLKILFWEKIKISFFHQNLHSVHISDIKRRRQRNHWTKRWVIEQHWLPLHKIISKLILTMYNYFMSLVRWLERSVERSVERWAIGWAIVWWIVRTIAQPIAHDDTSI